MTAAPAPSWRRTAVEHVCTIHRIDTTAADREPGRVGLYYLVVCDQGCNLGTTRAADTWRIATRRADFHELVQK